MPFVWDGIDAGELVAIGSVPFSTTSGAWITPTSTCFGAALAAVTPTAKARASPAARQRGNALFMRFAPFCELPLTALRGVDLPRSRGDQTKESCSLSRFGGAGRSVVRAGH